MTYADQWQVYDNTGRRKYVSEDERLRFLQASDRLPALGACLCRTLALTGCRISEALMLAHHQLDGPHCALTFKTLKQRKTRFRSVPIPDDLVVQLQALPACDEAHFWAMHRATAWRLVKATMDGAGIVGPMACCKGLRHGFGMHAARCNVPPNLIQRWMGHSSPVTTAIYLDAVGVEEREFAQRMWR